MAWSRVYHIYYDKSRRLSLSSSGYKARYLSYIQNSYASVYSFGTSSITPCSVIPLSCSALSTALVVVAIGLAGSVPIGRGDSYGAVWSVRGPVGVAVRFGVRSFGSEFWVGVLGRSLVRVRGGYTFTLGLDRTKISPVRSGPVRSGPVPVPQSGPASLIPGMSIFRILQK